MRGWLPINPKPHILMHCSCVFVCPLLPLALAFPLFDKLKNIVFSCPYICEANFTRGGGQGYHISKFSKKSSFVRGHFHTYLLIHCKRGALTLCKWGVCCPHKLSEIDDHLSSLKFASGNNTFIRLPVISPVLRLPLHIRLQRRCCHFNSICHWLNHNLLTATLQKASVRSTAK